MELVVESQGKISQEQREVEKRQVLELVFSYVGKRNYSSSDPTFLPDKEPGSNATSAFMVDDDYEAPPSHIFAGRLHSSSSVVHAWGLSPDEVLN